MKTATQNLLDIDFKDLTQDIKNLQTKSWLTMSLTSHLVHLGHNEIEVINYLNEYFKTGNN